MAKTRHSLVKDAVEAHSNLNTYAAVVALLEGGTVHGGRHGPASRIIAICKKAQQDELIRFDRARDGILFALAPATDGQIREWAERHGLDGLNLTDARAAFEDAESLLSGTSDGAKGER